ncbi:hypothetical protein ACFVUN_08995 [Kitasatospora griseola]|uniref:hypothetical protein n=1 Tax=Kitasatospora griseola TaxID=2064 RepID=UPI0036D8B3E3
MSDQSAEQPQQEMLGYCVRCGGYGRGEYAGVISSHSDAIRNHRGCSEAPNSAPVDRGER